MGMCDKQASIVHYKWPEVKGQPLPYEVGKIQRPTSGNWNLMITSLEGSLGRTLSLHIRSRSSLIGHKIVQ